MTDDKKSTPPPDTTDSYRDDFYFVWTWDVRNAVPPHKDPPGIVLPVLPPEDDQIVYQRINLMTFLLDGIPFDAFLDQPISFWIDDVIYKVKSQERWPGRAGTPARPNPRPDPHEDFPNNGLRELIHDTLVDIKREAGADAQGVKLRSLWDTKVEENRDPRVKVVFELFKSRWGSNPRFCLPFIELQDSIDAGAATPVDAEDMKDFICDMKGVTHYDLFTKSRKYFGDIAAAVVRGKQFGIFDGPIGCDPNTGTCGDSNVLLHGSGGSNNRVCHSGLNTCVTQTGSYCNADSNGYCVVG